MTASTEHTSPSACERLLDYVYGELAGEELEGFRAHLEGCAQCQAQLAGLQRVRGVIKQALPVVEPPPSAMGALQAQLLHAAAQRRAPRGKVLQLFRTVAVHPAYAAAAAFVLIGGAVGVQWSRGRLAMPPPAAESVTSAPAAAAPVPAVPVPGVAVPVPVAEPAAAVGAPAAPATIPADKAPHGPPSPSPSPSLENKQAKDRDTQLFLDAEVDGRQTHMAVSRPSEPSKPAAMPSKKKLDAYDNLDGFGAAQGLSKTSTLDALGGKGSAGGLRGGDTTTRDDAKREAASKPAVTLQRAVAPESPGVAPAPVAAPRSSVAAPRSRVAAPAPAAAGPPPAPPSSYATPVQQAATPAREPHGEKEASPAPQMRQNAAPKTGPAGASSAEQAVQAPAEANAPSHHAQAQAASADPTVLRAKAEQLASAGRCEDAVRLYQQLEQQYPAYELTPQQRLPLVQCLRATGRAQQTQNAADAKNAAPPSVNEAPAADEQRNLITRRSSPKAAAKRSKKSKSEPDSATLKPAF